MTSIKIITDRKFMSFLEENQIEGVSLCDATKLSDDEEVAREVEGVNLLFIVTNEIIADEISRIADSSKVDLILVVLREKFERHARRYTFNKAHTTTAIPYSTNQNEICRKIIGTIVESVNCGEVEFKTVVDFFYGSEYFEYQFGDVNNSRINWVGDDLQLRDVCFSTFRFHLYEVLNLKVVSTGKKHLTGRINKCIAYDDINDLKTDSDMVRTVRGGVDFLFLIVEPDRQNLWKYKKLVRIARKYGDHYPHVITISVSQDDSIRTTVADVNIRTNDLKSFYEDFIYRFDRRLKFEDDAINTLRSYRKVRIEYFKFELDGDNARLKEFVRNFKPRKFFMYIWFDYLHYDFDHKREYAEQSSILKQIDEMISYKEICGTDECSFYGHGGSIFVLEDKVLVAFYIKE